jgi:hypothetical protein
LAQGFAELIHNVYIGLFALAVVLALWLPKTGKGKLASAILATAVMSIPMVIGLKHQEERREQGAKEQVLVDRATKRFEELCKGAGAKIYRTVSDVDGLMLLKVRPKLELKDYGDPMLPGAAMAGERDGDNYIQSFLGVELKGPGNPDDWRGTISALIGGSLPQYRFVDVVAGAGSERYRYSLEREEVAPWTTQDAKMVPGRLKRETAKGAAPRYAVDYEDVVNPDDRKFWIAGTIVRVVDQQNNEVLGEYTTYVMDGGLGATDGTRSPWSHAASRELTCPPTRGSIDTRTRYFVDQVLKIKKEVPR